MEQPLAGRLQSLLAETPPGVWWATVLLAGTLLAGTFVQPIFRVPDERYHVDMIFAAMDGGGWPAVQERALSNEVVAAGRLSRRDVSDESLALAPRRPQPEPNCVPAGSVPDCSYKPTFDELDRTYEYKGPLNRMTQHPPAYYLLTGVIGATASSLTIQELPFDAQVWLYRLVSALLVLPLPLLTSLALREFGASARAQTLSGVLPAGIVGLTMRNGAIVNNDNLLLPLTFGIIVLLARTAARGGSTKRMILLGALVGLGLLTKGTMILTAISIPPALFFALRSGGSLNEQLARTIRASVLVAVASVPFGGWWLVRNLLTQGTVQPRGVRRADAPESFMPDFWHWLSTYATQLVHTGFGRLGSVILRREFLVALLVALLIALLIVGGRRLGLHRTLAVNMPLVVMCLAWGAFVYTAYTRTGVVAASNLRYFYPLMLGILVLAGVAFDALHRASATLVVVVTTVVLAVNIFEFRHQLVARWSDVHSVLDGIHTLSLWSPAPIAILLVGWMLAVIGAVGISLTARQPNR